MNVLFAVIIEFLLAKHFSQLSSLQNLLQLLLLKNKNDDAILKIFFQINLKLYHLKLPQPTSGFRLLNSQLIRMVI